MTIFGLDSAGKTAGAAILRDGALLYESTLRAGLTHSETLLRLCDAAFAVTGLTVRDVDVFACAAGPGSFTGLRIGLAVVKGLAFPYETPCAGVSTLEALAYSAGVGGTVLCALDARRGQAYWAAFHTEDGIVRRLTPDACTDAGEARGFAAGTDGTLWLAGDGAALMQKALETRKDVRLAPPDTRLGRACGVCRAAEKSGRTVPAAELAPDYHRLSQAQRERAERLGKI